MINYDFKIDTTPLQRAYGMQVQEEQLNMQREQMNQQQEQQEFLNVLELMKVDPKNAIKTYNEKLGNKYGIMEHQGKKDGYEIIKSGGKAFLFDPNKPYTGDGQLNFQEFKSSEAEGFTLSSGQKRYDQSGNVVAENSQIEDIKDFSNIRKRISDIATKIMNIQNYGSEDLVKLAMMKEWNPDFKIDKSNSEIALNTYNQEVKSLIAQLPENEKKTYMTFYFPNELNKDNGTYPEPSWNPNSSGTGIGDPTGEVSSYSKSIFSENNNFNEGTQEVNVKSNENLQIVKEYPDGRKAYKRPDGTLIIR